MKLHPETICPRRLKGLRYFSFIYGWNWECFLYYEVTSRVGNYKEWNNMKFMSSPPCECHPFKVVQRRFCSTQKTKVTPIGNNIIQQSIQKTQPVPCDHLARTPPFLPDRILHHNIPPKEYHVNTSLSTAHYSASRAGTLPPRLSLGAGNFGRRSYSESWLLGHPRGIKQQRN